MIRRAALCAFAVVLSACATRGPIDQQRVAPAWADRKAKLERIHNFSVQARAAVTGAASGSANLVWHQGPHDFDLRVSGPLGIGALTMAGDESEVRVHTKKQSFSTDDPEGTLRQALGWALPIKRLRYWVLSLPAPDSEFGMTLDEAGRVATLTQDGWKLNYTDYVTLKPVDLPRRILLTREDLKLRVIVDTWSDLVDQ
jgi:outer membrane lipoprotein LolB